MWLDDYKKQLYHYGVKGMKWGIRRTKQELASARAMRIRAEFTTNISGYGRSPKENDPNSIIDHYSVHGKVDIRTYYDENGLKSKDICATNHGNPKTHNFGEHGEHVDEYEWNEDGSLKEKRHRELTASEREENGDML